MKDIAVTSWHDGNLSHSASALLLEGLLPARLAMVEHGKKSIESYIEDVWRRHAMFLESFSWPYYCLPDGTVAERKIEIRFISLAEKPVESKLDIALLCRISHKDPEKSVNALLSQTEDLFGLLQSIQPESQWSTVGSQKKLEQLLRPFPCRFGAEISRRRGIVEVAGKVVPSTGNGSLRLFRIGFGGQEQTTPPPGKPENNSAEKLFTVFSYNNGMQGWDALCDRMLQHDNSLMIRFSLQPTLLAAEELDAFETLLGKMYALKSGFGETGEWRLPFTAQLETLTSHLSKQLMAFRKSVFELHTDILSDSPIPQGIAEYLGSTITRPGSYEKSLPKGTEILYGGFDWCFLDGGNQLDEAARRMNSIPFLGNAAPDNLRRWVYLMEPMEALSAFHPPFVCDDRFSGIRMLPVRTVPDPAYSDEGTVIAQNCHQGTARNVTIKVDDRRRHMYLIGQTGTGKTTMLEKMIIDDISHGHGVCLLDPHGDLVENVLHKIPPDRRSDLVYINPEDERRPVGINMLEYGNEREKQFVVQEMIAMMERLFDDKYGGNVTGPIFYHYFRMGLLYIMADDEHPPTLLDFYRFFNIPNYRYAFDRFVKKLQDPMLDAFRRGETFDFKRGQESTFASYITSKLDNFLADRMLRNIICQERSTIDFDDIINGKKILLVNLAKGAMGEINSRFFGMLMISKLQLAAMRRVKMKPTERADFFVYVDEFQNIATSNFAVLLAEARKYRMNMVLANQFVNQLRPDIIGALKGNVGSTVIFRCGVEDAEFFSRMTEPTFSKNDLMLMPNRHAVALLMKNGQISPPFTIETLLAPAAKDTADTASTVETSLSAYGRDRKEVEKEMSDSLQRRQEMIREEKKRIADMIPPPKREYN